MEPGSTAREVSSEQFFVDDPAEASPLSREVDPEQWVSTYLSRFLPRFGYVLEVGCGPGVIACAAARQRPTLTVTGVDISPQWVAQNLSRLPRNLILREADAVALPFVNGKFDVVYSRFPLEFLVDEQKAVDEMVRVCSVGGKVLLQDLNDHLVWHFPKDPQLQEGLRRLWDALGQRGFDPLVGRKLTALCKLAGLNDIRVTAENQPVYAGPIDEHHLQLWREKFDVVLPVAAGTLGGESAALALRERFLNYLKRDDSLTYPVLYTVEGTKPMINEDTAAIPLARAAIGP